MAFNLTGETFKYSKDTQLAEKIIDIVGLYLHPPEGASILCVDEKTQIQALDRTQPLLPLRPGLPARQTHDYKRNGTTSLFAALDVATGKVVGNCKKRHRHQEFLSFLRLLDRQYPVKEIHLVLDNYGTHKHAKVKEWLAQHPPLPPTLHPHQRILDEPGGDMVLDLHLPAGPQRQFQQRSGIGGCHSKVH